MATETPHDSDCPGCATARIIAEDGGAIVRDYAAHCHACGAIVQGDTEHTINGKNYCAECAQGSERDVNRSSSPAR